MKVLSTLASLTLILALSTASAFAAGGATPWSDSLKATALNGGPTLQNALDSLGYTINVATDEVPLQVLAPTVGGASGEVTLKYRSSASSPAFGWYSKATPNIKNQLFGGSALIGSMTTFTTPLGDSIGFYEGPTLYDDTWLSQAALNWDLFNHVKVFSTGTPGKYLLAWEDLPNGGDQDYQDYIAEVRFQDPNQLFLSFDGSSNVSVCNPDSICFQIHAAGGVGNLTLAEIISGTPSTLTSGPSPLSYRYCFLPTSYAITDYRFIFSLTDQGGNSLVDTFDVHLVFQNLPTLTVNPDFLDTLLCTIDTLCFDVVNATDPDGDAVKYTLLSGPGIIDSATGRICFLPNAVDSAEYRFIVMASDSCCYSLPLPREQLPCPRDTIIYRVRWHVAPTIVTIPDTTIKICQLEPVCFPVTASTPSGPVPVYQDCGPGSIAANKLCFTPTGAGQYIFCFYANNDCGGVVRDTVVVNIVLNRPPIAYAGRDSSLTLCAPTQICWPAGCADPDNDLESCQLISGLGTFNGTQICFTPTATGNFQFVMKATDLCGVSAYDTAFINVHLNRPPVAQVRDTVVSGCTTSQICLPASCSDPDGDLSSCILVSGPGTYNGTSICFTPPASGTYQFVLKATDACGAVAYDTGTAVVTVNHPPDITTGGGNFTLCAPETVCVPINVSDPDNDNLTFTSTMGKIVGRTLCVWSGGEGRRQWAVNVIAADPCGAKDTALYLINVLVNQTPIIQMPTLTPQNVCGPTQLCFTVTAIDSIMARLTYALQSGPGVLNPATGQLCFTPQSGGTFTWNIIVSDSCGKADTGTVNWQVNFISEPPAVVLPPAGDTVVCFGDTIGNICKDVTYSDPQLNTTITVVPSDAGISWSFGYNGGTGQLCFSPRVDVSRKYDFTFYRVNQCNDTATSVYSYDVTYDRCDSACMVVSIEQTPCITLGSQVQVDINVEQGKVAIGGFDMLIGYDVTAFTFIQASLGSAINGWEYFTYRLGPFGNCGGGCPSGMVRIVALADMNNGAAHPPASQFRPTGTVAVLTFRVTQNSSFAGLTYPVEFYWLDCGDNAVSTVTGDTLLIDKVIYNPEHVLWDEFDEINYPETGRYPGVGAPDECLIGGKEVPIRCVDYHNGFICIIANDSIDARGDMNLNGVANEISDAVLYTNYFLKGISVFTLSIPAQTAASDINNDGRTLTVGDLVYMLRIITGDALPIPKLSPFGDQASFRVQETDGMTRITAESPTQIGGLYLQLKTNGMAATELLKGLSLADMDVKTSIDGDRMSILISSISKGAVIPAGSVELFSVPGNCEVTHLEASDYYGNMLDTRVNKVGLPTDFVLGQNFPNPFNPTTNISFALPTPTEWTLSVINVSGQVVKHYTGFGAGTMTVTWDATDQSGQAVATGVYFYRLDAAGLSETRKMVLMK